MHRRSFLASTLLAAGLPYLPRGLPSFPPLPPVPRARSIPLAAVRLGPGPFLDAMNVNRRFLMAQDVDRQLRNFRVTAGLPSSAEPLGGWEAPTNELRGHYVGHYMSACALMWASAGDGELRARGDRIVEGLKPCQQASGYLSAFPEDMFDRLRAGKPAWAPFYTVHKIMAGLLDMHTLAGNAQALDLLQGMVRWTERWVQPLGDFEMARVLEREFGGMNELLYNFAEATGQERYRELAHRFDHERIFAPLAAGRDELKSLHCNTTIPKIVGAARRYELTGEARYHHVADYFWHEVTGSRCYCTGGTSNDESWNADPGVIAAELGPMTQEDCVTYNMLKLTGHLFQWTADASVADYHERALWNGILGSQHPSDGSKLYYVPLASGYWKLFGNPYHDYWCCTGTMSEAFSQLGRGIYFEDDAGLFVNQWIASELDWQSKGVGLVQETRFPEGDTVKLTVRTKSPRSFSLRVRVPWWARGDNTAQLNGKPLQGFGAPGGYYALSRTWKDGDSLTVRYPMRVYAEPTPDDPSLVALMYGPLVLAGRLGTEGLTPETIRAEPTAPYKVPEYKLPPVTAPALSGGADVAKEVQGPIANLSFKVKGEAGEVELLPFYRLFDERYAVYWRVT